MTALPAPPSVACPRCAKSTVTTGLREPWCPSCDWNLDQATPALFGIGWIDRRLHRVAGRLTDLAGRGTIVEADRIPRLTGLVQRVATAVGAPVPQVVMVGYDLNAFTAAGGLRRTRVLCIGLPLWRSAWRITS
ncbi:M48 family metalloprotease [Paractinoplanes durhamensis]|uniref:Uncharacterized protein n=1 Tax=Paractinoplanes durhamensis TaxID=113563 RepID=A0ABQ3YWT7_9ACTN|nr:hypothetical protein [Actinoplanes durhamensis]GIE01974.1 hypothetical protein Adu01nite_33240 [Actinoplanes durhamensis]